MQQYRWCVGTLSLVSEAEFWTSNISNIHKLAFLDGLFCYAASALVRRYLFLCRADSFLKTSLLYTGARFWRKRPQGTNDLQGS